MTLKRIDNKDFGDRKVFSGVKDWFGKKCLLVVDEDLQELRLLRENNDYAKHRRFLESCGCGYVHTSKYGEIIDVSSRVAREIENLFPGYCHTQWTIWNAA